MSENMVFPAVLYKHATEYRVVFVRVIFALFRLALNSPKVLFKEG